MYAKIIEQNVIVNIIYEPQKNYVLQVGGMNPNVQVYDPVG